MSTAAAKGSDGGDDGDGGDGGDDVGVDREEVLFFPVFFLHS